MAKDYAKARSKKKPSSRSNSSHSSRMSFGLLWLFIGVVAGLLIPSFSYIKQHVTRIVHGKQQTNDTLLRDPIPKKVKPGQHDQIQELNDRPQNPIKEVAQTQTQKKPTEEKVDFDFYTILPNSETLKAPATKNVQTAEETLLTPTAKKTQPAEAEPKSTQPKSKTEEILLPTPQIKTTPTKPTPPTVPKTPTKPPVNKTGYILQLGSFKTFEEADQLKAQLTLVGLNANIKKITLNNITRHRVWVGVYPSLEAAEKAQQRLSASNVKSSLAQLK